MKTKRVLVTGGAGYIGSILLPLLFQKGYSVTVYDSLMYGNVGLIPHLSNKQFSLVIDDIRNEVSLANEMAKNDTIIHLAALVGLPACQKNPQTALSTNVFGTQHVVNNRRPHQKLIYASTVSLYGASKEKSCHEGSALNPVSHYARTKTEAEKIIRDSQNAISLRFATAFGVSPRMRLDLLLNDFTYQAMTKKVLVLFEKSFVRTFAHVYDLAQSIVFSLDNYDKMKNSVFNIGDDALNLSKEEMALKIRERIDFDLQYDKSGVDEDRRDYRVSFARINSMGFRTEKTVEEGIVELIKAYRLDALHSRETNRDDSD
ncbi:MAG: SDR family oxidoreductase [Candidatus Aminicenantes bacterium]|jgi:nucleoside-diphosphate-sugar epimerase